MQIKFRDGLQLDHEIKEKISSNKVEEIFFKFNPEDTLIGYLNFRYSNEYLQTSVCKKGISRKIILDKKINGLKRDHYYKITNVVAYCHNEKTFFVSGLTTDLTDQVESEAFYTSNYFLLQVERVRKFVHPFQGEQRNQSYFPEVFPGFSWTEEQKKEGEFLLSRVKWYEGKKSSIPPKRLTNKPFGWGDSHPYEIFEILENKDSKIRNLIAIDIEKSIATVEIPTEVRVKKYTFTKEGEVASDEIYVSSDKQRHGVAVCGFCSKLEEIPVKLTKISETVGEQTSCMPQKSVRGLWDRPSVTNYTLYFKVKRDVYRVEGLSPETENKLSGDSLHSNWGGEQIFKNLFKEGDNFFLSVEYRVDMHE